MSYLPLKDGVISSNTLWSSTKITNYIDGEFSDKGLGGVTGLSDSNDNTLVTTITDGTSGLSGGKTKVPYFDTSDGGFTLLDNGFEILQSGSSKANFTDETLLSATRIQALVNDATSNVTTTLKGLDDTNISSESSGQFIRYNGSNWVNTGLTQTDISGLITTENSITGDTTIGIDYDDLITEIEGTGLSADTTSDTINVGEGTGITVNDDSVQLDTDDPRNEDHSTIGITGGTGLVTSGDLISGFSFSIEEGGVKKDLIDTGAVGSDEIQDGAVGTAEIDTNAVGSNEISGNAVTPTQLDTSQQYTFSASVKTDLSAPFDNKEFVPKSYVDGIKQGLDFKDSVDVAATDPINLSSDGISTIDGVDVTVTEPESNFDSGRVLLTNQDNAAENGIYKGDLSNPQSWVRADDADEDSEVTPGLYVFVEKGTQNGRRSFVLINSTQPTLGTDALTFAPFGQAGDFSAGNNIQISGQEISVVNTTSSGSGQILDFGSPDSIEPSDSLIAYDTDNNLSWTPGLSITDATNSEINVGFTGDTYLTASASGVTDGNQLDLEVNLDYGKLLNNIAGTGLTKDTSNDPDTIDVNTGSGITTQSDKVILDDEDPRNIDHGDIDISAESGLTVSGNLQTGFTYGIEEDGVQTKQIDQSIAPTWTGFHTFEDGLYTDNFRAGIKEVSGDTVSVSAEDYVLLVNTTDTDVTVLLPPVENLSGGEFFVFKKTSRDNLMQITPTPTDITERDVRIDKLEEYVTEGYGLTSIKVVYSAPNNFFII